MIFFWAAVATIARQHHGGKIWYRICTIHLLLIYVWLLLSDVVYLLSNVCVAAARSCVCVMLCSMRLLCGVDALVHSVHCA